MEYCHYCKQPIFQRGEMVVLCECEDARQERFDERQRRVLWRKNRTSAVADQQALRRVRRRTKIRELGESQ